MWKFANILLKIYALVRKQANFQVAAWSLAAWSLAANKRWHWNWSICPWLQAYSVFFLITWMSTSSCPNLVDLQQSYNELVPTTSLAGPVWTGLRKDTNKFISMSRGKIRSNVTKFKKRATQKSRFFFPLWRTEARLLKHPGHALISS